jgi:DNA gyrase/topoisomerase IV subunit A
MSEKILERPIEEILDENMNAYNFNVILGRAVPSIFDGLTVSPFK